MWLSTKNIHNVWLLQCTCTCTWIWPAGLGFVVNLAEALEDYIRLYCPASILGPLSPPFDLHIFPVSCTLEREGVDSRLARGVPGLIFDHTP